MALFINFQTGVWGRYIKLLCIYYLAHPRSEKNNSYIYAYMNGLGVGRYEYIPIYIIITPTD
jgi:hypothetical protein